MGYGFIGYIGAVKQVLHQYNHVLSAVLLLKTT